MLWVSSGVTPILGRLIFRNGGRGMVKKFIGWEFKNGQYEEQVWRCRKTVLLCGRAKLSL
jgi:hypothetical protein